jgi:CheY-like chemotaxis protein
MTHGALAGRRVLVVEDEAMIALMQVSLLESAGCTVVGPVRRVDAALRAIAEHRVDVAVLDINLFGEPVYPVADALTRRNVPFVFLTGYGDEEIPPVYRTRRRLVKPWDERELLETLCDALGAVDQPTA